MQQPGTVYKKISNVFPSNPKTENKNLLAFYHLKAYADFSLVRFYFSF